MSVFDQLGLGDRRTRGDWPYPRPSTGGPVPLSWLVNLVWGIGAPRENHRAGLAWKMDRFNSPLIGSNGEYPIIVSTFPIQTPISNLSNADVRYILSQPQNTIPNDVGWTAPT